MEEEEAHTETLICFFRYSPYFPPCPPRERPPLPSFAALFLLLSLLPFFFHFFFFSHAIRIPSPDCNSGPAFQPLEQQFIFIAMFYPSTPPIAHSFPRNPDLDRRSCSSSFYPRCSRVLSSFLSFFLSVPLALPVVSNFAKGWRRECAPRPSRGGVFFLPPPPLPSSTLHFVLLFYPPSFFPRSFFLPRPASFLFPAYTRCGRAIGKNINCEQRALPSGLIAAIYTGGICGVNGPLLIRATIARSAGDTAAIPRYTLTRDRTNTVNRC